jgi:hypothetical protein
MYCLLVLDSVTSTPQSIRQPTQPACRRSLSAKRKRHLISVKEVALSSVKTSFIAVTRIKHHLLVVMSVKRDLISVKRDLISVKEVALSSVYVLRTPSRAP